MSETQLLIDPIDLVGQLGDPRLRIFDAAVKLELQGKGYRAISGLADYEKEHIPGAAFMDLIETLSDTSTGLGFTLPKADDLAKAIGELGISAEDRVVVYSSAHMMWATRAFWLLSYLGHRRVSVLNGGLSRWQNEGHAVESGINRYAPAHFGAALHPQRFVLLDEMTQIVEAGRHCVANTLSPKVYSGEGSFHYGRPGHIPGSISVPTEDILIEGSFPSLGELRRKLEARGLAGDARTVTYCGGGISATVPAFARLLIGLDDTSVYDGSMSEWIRAGQPLKTGNDP
jgi:thiosulfate/3-mercaptopyruvate sulfurtransferase